MTDTVLVADIGEGFADAGFVLVLVFGLEVTFDEKDAAPVFSIDYPVSLGGSLVELRAMERPDLGDLEAIASRRHVSHTADVTHSVLLQFRKEIVEVLVKFRMLVVRLLEITDELHGVEHSGGIVECHQSSPCSSEILFWALSL